MSTDSPIIDELRARTMAISARYGHDLRKYAAHLVEVQRSCKERVVDQPGVGRSSIDEPVVDQSGDKQTNPAG